MFHLFVPKDKSLCIIIAAVVVIHLIVILWASLTGSFVKKPSTSIPQRLVVQTIALNPTSPSATSPPLVSTSSSPSRKTPILEPEKSSSLPLPSPPTPSPKPPPKSVEEKKVSKKEEKTPPASKPQEPKKESPVEKSTKAPVKSSPKPPPKAVSNNAKPVSTEKKPAKVNDDKVVAEKLVAEKKKTEKLAADKASEVRRKQETEEQAALKARKLEHLSKAQESMAKIAQKTPKVSSNKLSDLAEASLPKEIISLHIDAQVGTATQLDEHAITYREELAGRLKLLLKLPEYGAVRIKLTLERSGKVAKVEVVSAESVANRKHIEKTLPNLSFPSFGNNFGNDSQYTFSVTLSNEI